MVSSDAACRSLYKVAEASICLMRYDVGKVLYEAYINSCDDEDPGAWHGLAICLENAGRYEEARRAYERALGLHLRHEDPRSLLWGGWCAMKLGNYELAYRLFRESASRDPNYAYTWHSLAVAALKVGKRNEAEEAMSRYRAMISARPYDRRECEGLRMLMEVMHNISFDDALMGGLKDVIVNLFNQSMKDHGAKCGLTEGPSGRLWLSRASKSPMGQ